MKATGRAFVRGAFDTPASAAIVAAFSSCRTAAHPPIEPTPWTHRSASAAEDRSSIGGGCFSRLGSTAFMRRAWDTTARRAKFGAGVISDRTDRNVVRRLRADSLAPVCGNRPGGRHPRIGAQRGLAEVAMKKLLCTTRPPPLPIRTQRRPARFASRNDCNTSSMLYTCRLLEPAQDAGTRAVRQRSDRCATHAALTLRDGEVTKNSVALVARAF